MGSVEIQAMVDALGAELRRSVAVNDPAVRMLYASAHYGDEDEVRVRAVLHRDPGPEAVQHLLDQRVEDWPASGYLPPKPEIGMRARFVVPIRWRGELLGYTIVIDHEHALSAEHRAAVEALAEQLSVLLVEERHAADEDTRVAEQEVRDLVDTDAAVREVAVRSLSRHSWWSESAHARALVVAVRRGEGGRDSGRAPHEVALRHAVRAVAARHRGRLLVTVEDDRAVVVQLTATPVPDADAEDLATHLLDAVRPFLRGETPHIGIGDAVSDPARAWESARRAELACRGVGVLGAGPVAHASALGPLALLLRIPAGELDETAVPPAVRLLEREDPSGRLIETLEAYLRHGGAGSAAARELHVHRTTLYYRLDRLRELTGVELDDGVARLDLHLGLLARRLLRDEEGFDR